MGNFIEDNKRRAEQRKLAEEARRVSSSQSIASENISSVRRTKVELRAASTKIIADAQKTFSETGIKATLENLAEELNENMNERLRDSFYRAKAFYEGPLPSLDADELYCDMRLVWAVDRGYQSFADYEIEVKYYEDGRLEFISNSGEPVKGFSDIHRSRVLTRSQWSSNNDLVAEALQAAYFSPMITEHPRPPQADLPESSPFSR